MPTPKISSSVKKNSILENTVVVFFTDLKSEVIVCEVGKGVRGSGGSKPGCIGAQLLGKPSRHRGTQCPPERRLSFIVI